MNTAGRFALRFYLPLAFALFLVLLFIFSPKIIPDGSQVKLEAGFQIGIFGIKVPLATLVEQIWVIRGTLIAVVLACVMFAFNVDFSKYFPTLLRMDVYFDIRGIERTLNLFADQTRKDILLAENWNSLVAQYDEEVSVGLDQLWKSRGIQGTPPPEEFRRELLHAQGETLSRSRRLVCSRTRSSRVTGAWNTNLMYRRNPSVGFEGSFTCEILQRTIFVPYYLSYCARAPLN